MRLSTEGRGEGGGGSHGRGVPRTETDRSDAALHARSGGKYATRQIARAARPLVVAMALGRRAGVYSARVTHPCAHHIRTLRGGLWTCTYMHMHVYIYTYAHACTRTHMHMHMQRYSRCTWSDTNNAHAHAHVHTCFTPRLCALQVRAAELPS